MTKRSTNVTDRGFNSIKQIETKVSPTWEQNDEFESSTVRDILSLKSSEIFEPTMDDPISDCEVNRRTEGGIL